MSEPTLSQADPEVAELVRAEERRQAEKVRLIPSENYASRAVMDACGTVLNNKYSEGYAGQRYYEGQQQIDQVELLALERIKALFGADHANVQPYSGSPANLAVYLAFCRPGDPIMGMALPSGGHLSQGWSVSITGMFFQSHQYGVRRDDQRIDFDQVAKLARKHKPKLIFCGASAYPRVVDFDRFAEIARETGALLVADIAHIAGLVAAGVHPTPVGKAEVVTSTTHKTLRGPRGGIIMCDRKHRSAIDKAVFPGLQGGPHNGTTAAIAVAAGEAATDRFRRYAERVVKNAKVMADVLQSRGFDLVTGGTDNHLILIDLSNKKVPGKVASRALDRAGIVCNYNAVPFDTRKPADPGGIRLGTPATTSRRMGPDEMTRIGNWIADVVEAPDDEARLDRIAGEVREMCAAFPAPGLPL